MRNRLGLSCALGGVWLVLNCSVDTTGYSYESSGAGGKNDDGTGGAGSPSGGRGGAGTSGSSGKSGSGGSSNGGAAGDTAEGGTADEGGSAGTTSGGTSTGGAGTGGATGGTDGEGGQGQGGGGDGCGTGDAPATNACVITEERGVFVSPLGDDQGGAGTRDNPYATLAKGLTAAKTAGKRVYACAGTTAYQETLTIGAALDGSEVYGGFECSTWAYSTSRRAELTSTATTALTVDAIPTGVYIENLAITSANGSTPGASSIAVIVRNSQGITLRRVDVQAGDGANGATGTSGKAGASATAKGGVGLAPNCTATPMPAPAGATNCSSKGGVGGTYSSFESGTGAGFGTPQTGVTPASVNNAGKGTGGPPVDSGDANFDGGAGKAGSPGNNGTNGPAVAAQGVFGANGYTAPAASNGVAGNDAQGGGGGGNGHLYSGATCNNVATGGGGGAGGCGGAFGVGGGSGGASVAILTYKSAVVLDSCSLVAGDGGDGGNGGKGGNGGAGSEGGFGGNGLDPNAPGYNPLSGQGGNGGPGGAGGGGGGGAGGSGGPSYAVVYYGEAPVAKGSTALSFGTGGAAAPGGASAAGVVAPSGTAGVASPQFKQN